MVSRIAIWVFLIAASCSKSHGNGLDIHSVRPQEGATIGFEVSWENSWFLPDTVEPGNHDAVWVFAKGKRLDNGVWEHIDLAGTAGVSENGILHIVLPADRKGLFLRRASAGWGNVGNEPVIIDLEIDALEDYERIRLFGVEMVYVNEGSYFLGDSASNNTFGSYPEGRPYLVQNEGPIATGEQPGRLFALGGQFSPESDIGQEFPKGTRAFYCMKYEISQQQYVDFLNTLEPDAQNVREPDNSSVISLCGDDSDFPLERQGIRRAGFQSDGRNLYVNDLNPANPYNMEDDGQTVAANFLLWQDLLAYLDWAALRPMTELEFEKICRGPLYPDELEFAWGTTQTIDARTLLEAGTESETSGEIGSGISGLANYGYCAPTGPIRCGFAASAQGNRILSGSTYYGAMEMSGNVWEMVVPVSNEGLLFNGSNGDGVLGSDGSADEMNWPDSVAGVRGGGWNSGILPGFRDLAVSDRFFGFLDAESLRRGTVGGRGIRTLE